MHIIKDDNNCIDTVVKPVEIYPNPEVGFSFFPLCFGTATNFEDLTELPIGTNIGVWDWDFDDQGSTSSDQNPKHLFSEEGDFDVSLNVETEDGCTNDTTITIYIAPSPIADFNFADACINDEVSFTNETTGDFDNSQWILSNDSDTIFSTDIDNTFSTQGDYDVTLIVEDENYNCTDTITQTISIHPFPDLSFTADPMEGEPVLNVNFYTNTSGLSTNYWDFGNGNSSTSLNNTISNSFSDKGIFTVTHSGIDTNGCENSYSLEIVLDFGDVTYKIPNVLTPNDDGVNDGFYLTWFDARESITDFEIIILNRWGNLLKTYNDPDFIWNGENKSGNIVGDGTYFYKLQFSTIKGDDYNEHGFIHLVRD
jgi:gliding motility-associated-like protein